MQLQLFKNNQFGEVRVLRDENNEPWFVARDVAKILGYRDAYNMIRILDEEDTQKVSTLTNGGMQELLVINESGLYSAILRSKKQEAKKFKRWVTSEVLPSIRKHGAYITPQKIDEILTNPDTIIKLATKLKEEQQRRKQLENEVIELKPKAFFAEVVNNAEDAILVRDFAKLISKGNFSIGERRLFKWFRENGYIMQGTPPKPYQKWVDKGYFKVIEVTKTTEKGTRIFITTKITGKGQIYFQKKIYEYFNVKEGA